MTPSPKPRPSEREIAERILSGVQLVESFWGMRRLGLTDEMKPVTEAYKSREQLLSEIESALQDARRAALEDAAQEADVITKVYCADTDCGAWREGDKRCGKCPQNIGDDIADRIRSLPSPFPGGKP